MEKLIKCSEFVKRQTKNSRFSYYDGLWDELEDLAIKHFVNRKEGYRDGVFLISVPCEGFYTSICEVTSESKFKYVFDSRSDKEEPFFRRVLLNGKKQQAKFVDIIIYSHDVLKENNEHSCDAEYEIISINASIIENVPMTPMTMARNMLDKEGGTKAEYTGRQFAESIWFWKNHCFYEGGVNEKIK